MSKNPITIEALETIDAIDRRESFAKAAEELNKATSAVSYTVQKLEEQLDISLFQRQGRRSVLTPAGRLILAEGRAILQTTARLANQAKEVATGWEVRLNIALESLQSYSTFFGVLNNFLKAHPTIEVDVSESVLNGGWEALAQDKADLIVGSPGPVPLQKGYRAIPMGHADLVPVIAANHALAKQVMQKQNSVQEGDTAHKTAVHNSLMKLLPTIRRVITHDTSVHDVARSEGLSNGGKHFYVQTIDQKVEAIRAGIGIGHLPRHRIEEQLKSGELLSLALENTANHESFLAWKISNKGKGLKILTQQLMAALS